MEPTVSEHSVDSFGAKGTLEVGDASYEVFRLSAVEGSQRLPFSLKILLENLLRNEDGANITAAQIRALATTFLATYRAAYAAERSTFDGSFPLNAPPPWRAIPPYVSTLILRPVNPPSPRQSQTDPSDSPKNYGATPAAHTTPPATPAPAPAPRDPPESPTQPPPDAETKSTPSQSEPAAHPHSAPSPASCHPDANTEPPPPYAHPPTASPTDAPTKSATASTHPSHSTHTQTSSPDPPPPPNPTHHHLTDPSATHTTHSPPAQYPATAYQSH